MGGLLPPPLWMHTGLKVVEITEGFHTGVNLMKLVEAIGGESCGKPEKSTKMRIHKIQNINRALDKIKDHGVRLIGISSEGKFS